MDDELFRREGTVVLRQRLAPGAASEWHRDEHHRVTVVLRGQALRIEFRDNRPSITVKVAPGQVDRDQPLADPHRAVNVGDEPYEEVVVRLPRLSEA